MEHRADEESLTSAATCALSAPQGVHALRFVRAPNNVLLHLDHQLNNSTLQKFVT
jgi:hypothetical protein